MKNFIFGKTKTRQDILKRNINEINKQISAVKSIYNLETDPGMIDAHIYEICALENKINYLIKELKNTSEYQTEKKEDVEADNNKKIN